MPVLIARWPRDNKERQKRPEAGKEGKSGPGKDRLKSMTTRNRLAQLGACLIDADVAMTTYKERNVEIKEKKKKVSREKRIWEKEAQACAHYIAFKPMVNGAQSSTWLLSSINIIIIS